MEIIIVSDGMTPLYEQIKEQIKGQILQGKLEQGSILPSIRVLARELKVSIITVKRAYEELEQEGFAKTTPGKGTYVSLESKQRLMEMQISQMEEQLEEAIRRAKAIDMTLEDIQERVKLMYEEV